MSAEDVSGGAKVVLLGQTVVEKLNGRGEEPGGAHRPHQDGALPAGEEGQSPMGQDYDDAVLVPVSTFQPKVQGG
jgi:putative ABC transport system permease protein